MAAKCTIAAVIVATKCTIAAAKLFAATKIEFAAGCLVVLFFFFLSFFSFLFFLLFFFFLILTCNLVTYFELVSKNVECVIRSEVSLCVFVFVFIICFNRAHVALMSLAGYCLISPHAVPPVLSPHHSLCLSCF